MVDTHPVESWTLLFCLLLSMLALFGATVFVVGFFDSVVFVTLFTVDLLLSPGLSGLAAFEAALLDSLSFPLSFACLEEACVELVGVTDFLLLFICLQYSTEYKTLSLIIFIRQVFLILDEGDIGVCGIAVLDNFSCSIAVILILNCSIAVFSKSAGCGFLAFWKG